MAESEGDKRGPAAAQSCPIDHTTAGSAVGGATVEEETRRAVQMALDDALLSVGLGGLDLCGGREGEGGCPGSCSDPTCSAVASGVAGEPGREVREEEPMEEEREEEWVDITDQFTEAAALLPPGELVQDWSFNLLDAMSAVELLDPKLDASMQCLDFRKYPRSVAEAVAKGSLQLEGHTHSQLVGIFDEVLARLATWLQGFTLAQTVFSCLYLLDTNCPASHLLRGFSVGVVKTVDYMRELICRGGVFAEDDQQGVCFGFNMLTSVSDVSVVAALKDCDERVNAAVRQAERRRNGRDQQRDQRDQQRDKTDQQRDKTDQKRDKNDQQRGEGERTSPRETEVIRAVGVRIRFLRHLFGFVSLLKKRPVSEIQGVMSHLTLCRNLLPDIAASCPLGEKLDPLNPLKLGFHPLINHNLLPPSYRHCSIMSREEGLASLQLTLDQIDTVLGFGLLDSLRSLREGVRDFSLQPTVPNVLARSVMVLVCMPSDRSKTFGSPTLEEMMKRDAHEFCNPPSLNPRSPLSSSSQGRELTERFFGRTVHPMSELLRLYCLPRARQQEKSERVLDILGDLQHETQRIDQLQHDVAMKVDPSRQHLACYASWVLHHTLSLMIDYVVMGLEHGLYSLFELHYVYWYLEYLYGWLDTSWKTADKLNSEPSGAGAGGKGNKKKGRRQRKEAMERKEREVGVVQVKRLMCVGMMRAFEALILGGKIPTPEFQYGSQELCFQHRFSAFASILTPHLLTYADYQQLAGVHNYLGKDINLYDAASCHFSSAKVVLEGVGHPCQELHGLMRTAKTNIVVMNLSAGGHKRDSKVKPSLDYSLHPHFPVIRIQ